MKNKDNLVKKTNAKKENGTTKVNLPNKKMRQVNCIGGSRILVIFDNAYWEIFRLKITFKSVQKTNEKDKKNRENEHDY